MDGADVLRVLSKILLDTDPPFTAHNVDEVVGAGWDPRITDPRGRSLSVQFKYSFK